MASENKQFDAAVVGLGAAGCWAAKVLTERGLSVVALDAGSKLSHSHLPKDIKPATYLRTALFGRKWIQSRSISFHPQVEHLYVDDWDNPYSTRGGDTFLWIRGRQVGGRMHTWARMALRLSDADFKRSATDGYGQSWPIGYDDLAGYYDQVESFHGLRGSRDGMPQLPDGVVQEPAEFTEPASLFKRKVEACWPERRVVSPRVLLDGIDPIPPPLKCALSTDRLHLITDAPAARVLLNQKGDRAVGVEYVNRRTREVSSVRADKVFVCASSIESVRLLLNSRTSRHPAGIGNAHDQLGRYVLDHNLVVATGPTGEDYQGLASSWEPREFTPLDLSSQLDFYIPDFAATLSDRSFTRGFGIQGRISPTHWGMAVFGEMLPRAENRVTLSQRKDGAGIPTVNISLRRGENDRRMIRAQKRQVRLITEAAGLEIKMPVPGILGKTLWKMVGPELGVMHLGIAIHETGGARMGDDPTTSVTNARNQIWQVPNLYVTDGSCFPGTGCQNPTLTIMALTARACDLAVQEAGAVAM